jgi:Flp pilus assembly protein TadG
MTMRARRRRGVVAVEFALVLPLLLLLLLGMFDYGWYFLCELNVTNAAREGARAGTTVPNGDATRARTTALGFLAGAGLGAQPTAVTVTVGANPTTVAVDVSMHFKPLVGFVPLPSDGAGAYAHAYAVMQGVP